MEIILYIFMEIIFSGLNTKHKNVLTAPDDVEVARMIQRQAC